MFKLFGQKADGYIGYFKLSKWWFKTFTKEERMYISKTYKPAMSSKPKYNVLIEGEISDLSTSPLSFLSSLSSYFKKPKDYSIASRILDKANDYVRRGEILNIHFFYLAQIRLHYSMRDKHPQALDNAVDACRKQISISKKAVKAFKKLKYIKKTPEHTGYKQLCIILERQGKYGEVIKLSKEAKKQGWTGNWDNRIAKCQKKLKVSG